MTTVVVIVVAIVVANVVANVVVMHAINKFHVSVSVGLFSNRF